MQSHSNWNPCVPLQEPGGPLQSYILDFTDSLANRGYSKACIAYKVHLVRAFDQWMRQRRIKMQGFTEKRIQEFIRHRAKRYSKERGDAATLRSLLKRLQEANVVSYLQPKMSALDQLQLRFAQYLTEQRGLRPKSVRQYLFHTRRFLVERFAHGPLSLSELNAQDIVRCILRQARIVSPHAARCRADGRDGARRLHALILFLRYTGLRISDAVGCSADRLQNGKLWLYTQKTGQHVYCPIPEFVARELDSIPGMSERYWFWSGHGSLETARKEWSDKLARVFEDAKVDGHAHQFRDTFAVELLKAGIPIERVSVLLGHASVRITEKHYNPWNQARQAQAEADVQRAWQRDPMVALERRFQQFGRVSGTRH